jgi:hypothetical protein
MNCPPAIAEVMLKILQMGLLQIRACGWQNDAATCARQADHLHNIPTLLTDFSPERLLYYWQVERPQATNASESPWNDACLPLWARLEKLLPTANGLPPGATASSTRAVLPRPPG